MKRKIIRYIIPGLAAAVLTTLSCFDMYNELLENTDGSSYRLSIAETTNARTRLLKVNIDGTIIPSSFDISAIILFKSVFADFNNDGNIDIFTMSVNPQNPLISYSDGNGNITSTLTLPIFNDAVSDIAVADLDNNGFLDLVIGTTVGPQKFYYKNNYPSGFSGPVVVPISSPNGSGYGVSAADFDGDGDKDIYIGNNGAGGESSQLWINEFNISGAFTNKTSWTSSPPTATGITDSASGDLDNDGDLDIIEVGTLAPFTQVWLNTGGAYFNPGWNLNVSLDQIELADFDSDGDLDAYAVSNTSTTNYILINNGNGQFTAIPHTVPTFTYSIAIGDFDLDYNIDIIISGTADLYIYRNDGYGNLSLWKTYPSLGTSRISTGAMYQ